MKTLLMQHFVVVIDAGMIDVNQYLTVKKVNKRMIFFETNLLF